MSQGSDYPSKRRHSNKTDGIRAMHTSRSTVGKPHRRFCEIGLRLRWHIWAMNEETAAQVWIRATVSVRDCGHHFGPGWPGTPCLYVPHFRLPAGSKELQTKNRLTQEKGRPRQTVEHPATSPVRSKTHARDRRPLGRRTRERRTGRLWDNSQWAIQRTRRTRYGGETPTAETGVTDACMACFCWLDWRFRASQKWV